MRKSAMREHGTACDIKRISDDIGVGNHRATGGEQPEPNRDGFFDKGFARYRGEYGVRKDCRHKIIRILERGNYPITPSAKQKTVHYFTANGPGEIKPIESF